MLAPSMDGLVGRIARTESVVLIGSEPFDGRDAAARNVRNFYE
jgi:hypothetical protein